MQETQISNERLTIPFAHVAETGHSAFRDPLVNQVEQRLIRQRPRRGPADDVWRMLTAEAHRVHGKSRISARKRAFP